MILERFGKVEAFAEVLNISKQSVYNWLNGEHAPEETRFLDIVAKLELEEEDIEKLLGVPPLQVVFRRTGGSKEASKESIQKGRDLADTFFKIDASSYVIKEGTLTAYISKPDHTEIARQIRQKINIPEDEPVILNDLIYELKKYNLNIFFLPLQKIGLAEQFKSNREVAFSAIKADRVIVFVDTNRSKDEVLFDVCHELSHLIFDSTEMEKGFDEEGLCNLVAQNLIYPPKFLQKNSKILEIFYDAVKYSCNEWVDVFRRLQQEFDWSPKGLGIALRQYGHIKQSSHEFNRFMSLDKLFKKDRKTLEHLYFNYFAPQDYEKMLRFFTEEVQTDREIYQALVKLRDSAISEKISSRRLAEILNMDSGDVHELINSWQLEQSAEVNEDAKV
jgi:hypothetical protein